MLTGSSPTVRSFWKRLKTAFPAGLFVAAYVVGTPWHIVQDHHHEGLPPEAHGDAAHVAANHAPGHHDDHESHCHPQDHPGNHDHSRAEHSWVGLPPKSVEWSLCKVLLELPPSEHADRPQVPAPEFEFVVVAESPSAPPPRRSRPRGPPLS